LFPFITTARTSGSPIDGTAHVPVYAKTFPVKSVAPLFSTLKTLRKAVGSATLVVPFNATVCSTRVQSIASHWTDVSCVSPPFVDAIEAMGAVLKASYT